MKSTVLALLAALLVGGAPAGLQARPAEPGAESLESLVYDLKHPDPARRKKAAEKLGDLGSRDAVPPLIEAASDGDADVRKEVLAALNKLRDLRAIPAYASLSRDGYRDIRKSAIAALVNLYVARETGLVAGAKRLVDIINPFSSAEDDLVIEPYTAVDAETISAISERLTDSEEEIREAAAKALGILRARSALPAMLEALRTDTSKKVKVAIMRSFYKIGDNSVGPALMPLIYTSDREVRHEAIETIGLLKVKEATPDLIKLYQTAPEERKRLLKVVPATSTEELQLRSLEALARIGAREAEDLFVKALRHPKDDFRQAGAEGLARIADPVMVVVVQKEFLREKDKNVRLAESFALFRMGRSEYLQELVDALSSMMLRNQAQAYLMELSGEEAKLLYPYLRQGNSETKIRLAEVLGHIGDASALPHLEALGRSDDSEVAAAANQAIRRINARISLANSR